MPFVFIQLRLVLPFYLILKTFSALHPFWFSVCCFELSPFSLSINRATNDRLRIGWRKQKFACTANHQFNDNSSIELSGFSLPKQYIYLLNIFGSFLARYFKTRLSMTHHFPGYLNIVYDLISNIYINLLNEEKKEQKKNRNKN